MSSPRVAIAWVVFGTLACGADDELTGQDGDDRVEVWSAR